MGLRVKIGVSGGNVIMVLMIPIEDYEEAYRGALLMYKCQGESTKNPLARYIADSLKYLESIRNCKET
ncbi:hypothetical protein [Caldivirga maquilingensis]|uniref:hypothetical protein n=1 Tax=Caldivirga maquilingensis TaxID=76887 RepID=UPI00064F5456|nr:hypothetical protein [Caldivirga maquilingensis]